MSNNLNIDKTQDILIVDDAIDSLKLMRDILVSEGYKVRPASSGELAVEAVHAKIPDLILLDLKMPGMNGYEVCKILKSDDRTKSIPIIAVTALTDIQSMIKSFNYGAVDYIVKPIVEEELLVRVRTHLDLSKAKKEIEEHKQDLEQKVAERTRDLLKSQNIIDTSTEVIICTDLKGNITFWNKPAERLYSYTSDEILGKPISVIYREEDNVKLDYFIESLMLGDVIQNIESVNIDKFGNEVTVHMSLTSIKNENGDIIELVGFSRDITEKKRIQSDFNRINLLFEDASEMAKIGGWEIDLEDGSHLFTKQIYDIYEIPRGELPSIEEGINHYHPDHRELVRKSVNDAMEKHIPYDIEVKLITAKNNEIWVHTKGYPIVKDGEVVKLYGSIQDITERKNMELELTKAQEIASIGSWTLNNKTGEIKWSKELYKMYGFDPDLPIPPYEEHAKFLPYESWELLNKSIDNTARTGDPYSIQFRTNNKKGAWQWVNGQGEAIFDSNNEIIGLRGIAQDITHQKLAEQKIEENKDYVKAILNSLKYSICVINEKGEIIEVNDSWGNFENEMDPELKGEKFSNYNYYDECLKSLSFEDKRFVIQGLKDVFNGKLIDFNHEYAKHNVHEEKWFYMRASLMKITDKQVVISHVDITDLKKTQTALIDSERRFVNMASKMPGAIFQYLLHPDGTDSVQYVNDGCYDLWEITAEEVSNNASALWEMIHPDDLQPMIDSVQHSGETGEPWTFQWRITTPSGKKKWLEGAGNPEKLENGDVLWDTMIMDVTQRKLADEKLALSESRLETAQKIASIGDFVHDFENNTVRWSDTLFDVLGYERADIPPKYETFISRVHPDDAEVLNQLVQRAMEHGEDYTITYRYEFPNNEIRYIYVTAEVDFNSEEKPIGLVGTAQDITQLKLTEIELRESREIILLKNEISNLVILSSGNEIFKSILDIVLEKIECRFGYFGYIDNSNGEKLVCPSMTYDIWDACEVPDKSIEFPRESWTGVWGDSLIHKKSIYKNENLSTPNGHVSLNNALAVPLMYRDDLIGQITVANKPSDFNEKDKILLEEICNYISPFIQAYLKENKYRTDLLIAKSAAEESEERFQAFMQNIPARVFIKDDDLKYIYGNKEMLEYTGKSEEDLFGSSAGELMEEERSAFLEDIDKRVLKSNKKVESEFETVNGDTKWKKNIKFPIKLSNDKLMIGGITFDITEKKQVEFDLKEALAEVTELKNKYEKENIYLKEEIDVTFNYQNMIYASNEISDVLNQVDMVAGTNATVLLQGESGTGKEIIARAIHSNSQKKDKPLIKVNCAAIPHELIESELFGHKKGSFTGAISDRVGKFELADGGTLFLDEIGELPIEMQPKLLRALQEGEIEPIGGSKTVKVDVRIIAATNRKLKEEIEKEKFREDLYFRLNVFPIIIPPLRERTDDIPVLINHFVTKFSEKYRKEIKSILKQDLDSMMKYEWPGNVRELQNIIERAVIISKGDYISINQDSKKAPNKKRDIKFIGKTLNDVQRDHIIRTLKKTNWKITGDDGAAKILDIKPSTLRDRMKKLHIQKP